jgi:hypothetical protein
VGGKPQKRPCIPPDDGILLQRLWAKLRKYEVAYEEKQQKNSDCLYPKETVKPEEKQASPDDPLAGGKHLLSMHLIRTDSTSSTF